MLHGIQVFHLPEHIMLYKKKQILKKIRQPVQQTEKLNEDRNKTD